ncbi:MAG: hypothetical protein ACP5ME_03740 [Anaerolineae bacterium]
MLVVPATQSRRGERAPASGTAQRRESALKGFSGLALAIFCVLLIISVILAAVLDSLGVPDGWIAAEIILLNLVGLYILFALRVANQWEKAIVRGWGASGASRDRGRSGLSRSWTPSRRWWTTG